MTKWQKGVGATVSAAIIIMGLKLWVGHLAQAKEDHESITKAQQVQAELVELTKALGQRALAEDAKLERDAELCGAGLINDPIICREAQMYLNRREK
jgi:hypothetical protein